MNLEQFVNTGVQKRPGVFSIPKPAQPSRIAALPAQALWEAFVEPLVVKQLLSRVAPCDDCGSSHRGTRFEEDDA